LALERSKRLILGAIMRENVYFTRLSETLENKYFHNYTGHFTIEGREKLAEALAPRVLEILKADPAERTNLFSQDSNAVKKQAAATRRLRDSVLFPDNELEE
jgi:hypothetical protein